MPEDKERLTTEFQENRGQERGPGMVDVQQRREEDQLPAGVESWMTRVEKAAPKTTVNDSSTGQPVLQPSMASQTPKKALPTTRSVFSRGFSQAVSDANRWLSEFIFRIIKMNDGKVEFKKEEISNQ